MKKQLQRNYGGFIAVLGAFVVTFLGLGACMNPVQGPAERSPDGSTGVRISIVAGEARTLLPSLSFSKYVLSFSTGDSVTIPGDVTITDTTGIIALEPADWTITVTAYVEVGGDDGPNYVAAAEGSAQVSLAAGDLKGALIRVSSKLDGGNGYFSYSAQYPADVTYGSLQVYDSGGQTVITNYNEPSGDRIPLAPGYYRLRIYLQTNYGVAVRTEIVHIYPGMETRGDYVFSADDFGSPIEISGTVDLSGLETVGYASIRLCRDSDFTYQEASYSESSPSDPWAWTARALPFNQPTDLYVEFTAEFSSGAVLTKRLEIPFSVYDVDCAAPNLGPFTVNRFDLSGVVDFSALDSLGLPHGYTEVIVYQDSGARIGSASVNAGSWSLGIMTEETSLPARIVLRTNIPSLGYIYDEITTSLSASRSDLDFAPGPLSAGTVYNGRSIGNNYSYLFAPDSAGNYAFKLSGAGSGYADLTLYDTSGNSLAYTSGNPDAALACSLSAGTACYIQLYLESPSRAFQFQVNPVSQANLGGTVDFSGLLSHLSGVSVSNAAVSVYAGSGAHTLLGTGTVNTGSWSAAVDLDGPSVPAVFVVAANLDNGRTVYHQEAGVISGNDSGLIFSPAAVTGESSSTRMTVNQYDYLLYVPTETGDYSLRVNAGAHYYMELTLYDAQTGNHIANTYGYDELELISELNVGTPYRVSVHSDAYFATYQFQAEVLEPVTLSGSVNLNGLAPLSGDINYTEISVYNGAASPVQLGSATADAIGSWSALIPASGTQTVRIVARVSLKSGREITACIEAAISGDTAGLDLAPAALSPAGTPIVRAGAYSRDGFLLVPSASGFFNLEAISGSYTPDLALYDTAGAALANGSSGSLYAALTAGTPYIVYVYNIGSFTPYQFRMTAMSSMSIGGTVNYTGLPASIRAIISSATVGGYVDNPAHTLVVSNTPVADESWSALVPAAATGQTVRLALTLHLSNGRSIYSQIQTVLAASATDLDFAPSVVSGGGAAISGKTAANGDDQFLIVPSAGGVYELQAGSDTYIRLAVYNGLTGDGIESSSYNYLSSVITPALNAETPYIISISANGYSFHDYQFSFDALPPVTLGGSVDFSGLSAWTSDSAGVLIFAGANYALLGTGAVNLSGNSWSASASLPGEVFIALVALSSGGEGVLETQTVSVSGDNNSIAFSPQDSGKNLATGQWHDRSAAAGSRGDWLLWIPENTGEYALDAERTDGSWDTYMYLYDGLSGAQIASDDDGGDGNNSRIQRSDFIAWKPYLVRVRGYGNNAGTFRFKAEMVSN